MPRGKSKVEKISKDDEVIAPRWAKSTEGRSIDKDDEIGTVLLTWYNREEKKYQALVDFQKGNFRGILTYNFNDLIKVL